MKIEVVLDVAVNDGSSPHGQDAVAAVAALIGGSDLSWFDRSLDKQLRARMNLLRIQEVADECS